jgi:hypothetical protein
MGQGGRRQQQCVKLASSARRGHLGTNHCRMAEGYSFSGMGVLRSLSACDRHTGLGQRKRRDRRSGADHELSPGKAVELRHV